MCVREAGLQGDGAPVRGDRLSVSSLGAEHDAERVVRFGKIGFALERRLQRCGRAVKIARAMGGNPANVQRQSVPGLARQNPLAQPKRLVHSTGAQVGESGFEGAVVTLRPPCHRAPLRSFAPRGPRRPRDQASISTASPSAAWAAASLAMGTRKGEHDT